MTLFGTGREVGGLEPVLDILGDELVAEDPVEGVGEGDSSDSETPRSRMSRSTARINFPA